MNLADLGDASVLSISVQTRSIEQALARNVTWEEVPPHIFDKIVENLKSIRSTDRKNAQISNNHSALDAGSSKDRNPLRAFRPGLSRKIGATRSEGMCL